MEYNLCSWTKIYIPVRSGEKALPGQQGLYSIDTYHLRLMEIIGALSKRLAILKSLALIITGRESLFSE